MTHVIVCGHTVHPLYIIGIGPLMTQLHPDLAERTLYNSRKLSFQLHLRNYSLEISSDFLSLGKDETTDKDFLKAREEFQRFRDRYKEASDMVKALISEQEAVGS